MGGQMELYSIYCGSVVYKDKEDKIRVECGQIREEKDTQAIALADLQEVSVGLQSPLVTPQGVFVDLQSAPAPSQQVIWCIKCTLVPSQRAIWYIKCAHATSQRAIWCIKCAHATSQRVIWCIKCAHATSQRVIWCIKCAPAIFFALFGRCFSVGLSTVARQTNPNRSCRRVGDAF